MHPNLAAVPTNLDRQSMPEFHRLLQRQLKRHFGHLSCIPDEWQGFLQSVNEVYEQFDSDRMMLERSLELSSQELLETNGQLSALLETMESQVEERTAELTQTNAELAQTLQELQAAQGQLVHSEKMSALGQLVAGIAHEINNPVNFIHGNLRHAHTYLNELLEFIHRYFQSHPTPHPDLAAYADEIDLPFLMEDLPKLLNSMRTGSDRIRAIVLSLRNFSRLDEAEVKSVDIHEGIESTLMLLEHRLKIRSDRPSIVLAKQYGQLPPIDCCAGQINQVFMNILANAIDALDESHQTICPTITIRTEQLDSQRICVAIADNGCGIPDSLQARLFDPFFTTKPVGKGTGLGLAISYKIVQEKHGGQLMCSSQVNLGTEFQIILPIRQTEEKFDSAA